jgi:uncharacterized protein YkwD
MRFISALGFLLVTVFAFCQEKLSKAETEFVITVNQARKAPQDFAETNKAALEKYAPAFLKALKTATPIPELKVSKGLCIGAKKSSEGDLNPEYPEQSSFCKTSSGKRSGGKKKIIEYVADYYNNVLSPDYSHIGLVIIEKGATSEMAIFWSRACDYIAPTYKFSFTEKIDTSKVDFKKINTAVNSAFMSAGEKEMVKEINFARCYPKEYAQIVSVFMEEESKKWNGLNHDDYVALLELVEELKKMKPLNALLPSECIFNAAKKHGLDEVKRGFDGHTGSDGSSPWDRIIQGCPDIANGNENLCGGSRGTARAGVIILLVDGGISTRGHRYNMLDAQWTHVACYYAGDVGSMPDCWVQNFGKKK